jgi:hypothetical protein
MRQAVTAAAAKCYRRTLPDREAASQGGTGGDQVRAQHMTNVPAAAALQSLQRVVQQCASFSTALTSRTVLERPIASAEVQRC